MEIFGGLFLLGLCVTILVGSILGIAAFSRNKKLSKRVRMLEAQINTLRVALASSKPDDEHSVSQPSISQPTAPPTEEDSKPDSDPVTASPPQIWRSSAASASSIDDKASVPISNSPASSSAQPRSTRGSVEEKIGSRWSVWVGGLALVLGGIFLVRYSIDTGLLGPVQRVISAGLFALLLYIGGEFLRRRPTFARIGDFAQSSYIPGILTLAGTTTAFAAIYSAHVLYNLIEPGTAFAMLALIAIGTLALSLLQGPLLASTGLLASYIVPFLVQSSDPAPWILAIYGLVISLGCYAISRLRNWQWFATLTVIAGFVWGHVVAFAAPAQLGGAALAFYDVILLTATIATFVFGIFERNAAAPPKLIDRETSFFVVLNSWLVIYLLHQSNFDATGTTALLITLILLMATAFFWPMLGPVALGAPLLAILGYLSWDVRIPVDELLLDQPIITYAIDKFMVIPNAQSFIVNGLMLGLLMGIGGFAGAYLSTARLFLAVSSVAGPTGIFFIALWRSEALDVQPFFGATALAMAAAYLGALSFLERRLDAKDHDRIPTLASYATATIGLIATAIVILLGDGWVQLGLAALCASTIWVGGRWLMPGLGRCALGLGVLVLVSIYWQPTIVPADDLSTTPFFNALLWGYGGPTLIFWWCAIKLHKLSLTAASEIKMSICQQSLAFQGLAIFTSLATGAVLIHHATNDGLFYSPADTLMEWSLQSLLALSASIGLERIARSLRSPLISKCIIGLGFLSFALVAVLNLLALNPLVTNEFIGEGVFLNQLLLAYLLPAVLTGLLATRFSEGKPDIYRHTAGILSVLLSFCWISLQVRQLFHLGYLGYDLAWSDAELYSYSAAWLTFGIGLLAYGIWRGVHYIRIASGAFVALAAAKAFLFDMASLDGIWRAMSFIGLGLVLVSIGLLYQRLLSRASHAAEQNPPSSTGPTAPQKED